MHRNTVSSLAGVVSTSSATLRGTTRRHASTVPRQRDAARKKYVTKDKIKIAKKLAVTAEGLVSAAATKQNASGWRHTKHYEGETRRLASAIKSSQNPHKLPSVEYQEFRAEECRANELVLATESVARRRFTPGTMVEVRRSEVVVQGVVLFTVPVEGLWMVHTLTSTGEVWPHMEADVMFSFPNFIEPDLVTRCGTYGNIELGESEIAARVKVLKLLRDFELEAEHRTASMQDVLGSLYDRLKNPDPDKASMYNVDQATDAIMPEPPGPTMNKWVVHRYLFNKAKYFGAVALDAMSELAFVVRSQRDVEDLSAMDRLVVTKDPILNTFVEKARKLILAARKRERDTWGQLPSYQLNDSIAFTPEEMQIVRFLRSALRRVRTIQRDPYLVSQSYILKKIGLYTTVEYDARVVHQLLVELGFMPPWVDPVTRVTEQADPAITEPTLFDDRLAHDQPASAHDSSSTPSQPPTAALPLGPDDFYSRDLVEHLRHDFGDMPVYVIDDVGAEELDDGLSIERIPSEPDNVWLHIHIADPTVVIPPTHRIAKEALKRMETRYFLDRTIPMLPGVPQLNSTSLGASGLQNVITFSSKLDLNGSILDYTVRPGIIKNPRTMRYSDVTAAMGVFERPPLFPFGGAEEAGPVPNPAVVEPSELDDLLLIREYLKGVTRQRVRAGAIQYAWPEAFIAINPKPVPEVATTSQPYSWSGFPTMTYKVLDFRMSEEGARQIVAESMRLAGRIASRWLRDRGIAALRRVAQIPTESIPGGLQRVHAQRDEDGFVDYFFTYRNGIIFDAANYLPQVGPHSVLGIEADEGYMRTTSPLRRFLDMLTHWQIKHTLLSPDTRAFSDEWLERFGKQATQWEHRARRMDQFHFTYWANKFLERFRAEQKREGRADQLAILDSLEGTVVRDPQTNWHLMYEQVNVIMPRLGLKGTVMGLERGTSEYMRVGDAMRVKLDRIELGLSPNLFLTKK